MAIDASPVLLDIDGLGALIDQLHADGREVYGPVVRQGAIQTGSLRSVADLPRGWRDEQAPGRYRVTEDPTPARFAWAVGPQTWKPLLHPPRVRTVTIRRRGTTVDADGERVTRGGAGELEIRPEPQPPRRLALFGLRPCDLAAIERLDRVLGEGVAAEPVYAARRRDAFLVVVECTAPADTCFCTSMGTGPGIDESSPPHDLTLTELVDGDEVRYLARPVSDAGARVLAAATADVATADVDTADVDTADVDTAVTTPAAVDDARAAVAAAATSIRRRLDGSGLPETLIAAHDHPVWDEIADRCLACGNCTAVCPTCFCTDLNDTTDLSGTTAERWRTWATCYDPEFSRLGARLVRSSTMSRYRQWLTHKLATWHDQFGQSGCVGCGRCITWCPVGIDLTVEVDALAASGAAP